MSIAKPEQASRLARNIANVGAILMVFSTLCLIIRIATHQRDVSPCGKEFSDYLDAVANSSDDTSAYHCLQSVWQSRRDREPFVIFFLLMQMLSVLCFLPPILNLSELQGSVGKYHVMVPAFVCFVFIGIIEVMLMLGLTTTTNWMASRWHGNVRFLQMLETAFWVSQSSMTWFFAADYLCLGIGMLSLSRSLTGALEAYSTRSFRCITITLGVLCILNFFFEVLRFGSWRVGMGLSAACIGLIGFILLPAWLVLLGNVLTQKAAGMDSLMQDVARESAGINGMELPNGEYGSAGRT